MTAVEPIEGAGAPDMARWTFMVYLDADNNLESAGVEDMNEMETVGSTDDVNILAQFDRIPEYDVTNGDWTDTRRYRLIKDDKKEEIGSPVLEELGEVNMGDPENLIDFVLWGAENYPAEHYAVILWNHGGAFWGVCFDDTGDGNQADALTMPDLRYAFQEIRSELGRDIDLVGFDACLMAEVAVLYQLRDIVDFTVASGFVEPGDGWPYETILPRLVENPALSPVELGKHISDTYVESYTDSESDPDDTTAITMSVFDMAKIATGVERLNEFAMVLSTSALVHNAQIWTARDRTESYDMVNAGPFDFTGYAMYDIIDFTDKIQQFVPFDSEVKQAAQELRSALTDFIVYGKADEYHPFAHGLTIYFPNAETTAADAPGRNSYDDRFNDVDFAQEKYWDNFLFHYYARENADDTPPTVVITNLKNNATFENRLKTLTLEGSAFDAQDTPLVELRMDGGEWYAVKTDKTLTTGAVLWTYDLDLAEMEGEHTIELKVKDNSGNTQQQTYNIKVIDTTVHESEKTSATPYIIAGIIILIILIVLFILVTRMRQLRK
jgi:clostripain